MGASVAATNEARTMSFDFIGLYNHKPAVARQVGPGTCSATFELQNPLANSGTPNQDNTWSVFVFLTALLRATYGENENTCVTHGSHNYKQEEEKTRSSDRIGLLKPQASSGSPQSGQNNLL